MVSRPEGIQRILADLHVHTVASACAEIEMIPPLIVRRALALGLGLVAITDHNTIDNVAAVQRAAQGTGLIVLPGMEVQTREEVHIICLFDELAQAQAWQDIVYEHLPAAKNRPEFFGAQMVVDHTAEFVRLNERLLATSTRLSVEQVVGQVNVLGGLAIAAHIDRPSFSMLANLGFIPQGLGLAALEVSRRTTPAAFLAQHPELAGWPMIHFGRRASTGRNVRRDPLSYRAQKLCRTGHGPSRPSRPLHRGRRIRMCITAARCAIPF